MANQNNMHNLTTLIKRWVNSFPTLTMGIARSLQSSCSPIITIQATAGQLQSMTIC
jgi:hypothetical protein